MPSPGRYRVVSSRKKVYKEEVLGRHVEVGLETPGDNTNAPQFFKGQIWKLRREETLGLTMYLYTHYVIFEDGEGDWFDLGEKELKGHVRWVLDSQVKEESKRETAAVVKQEGGGVLEERRAQPGVDQQPGAAADSLPQAPSAPAQEARQNAPGELQESRREPADREALARGAPARAHNLIEVVDDTEDEEEGEHQRKYAPVAAASTSIPRRRGSSSRTTASEGRRKPAARDNINNYSLRSPSASTTGNSSQRTSRLQRKASFSQTATSNNNKYSPQIAKTTDHVCPYCSKVLKSGPGVRQHILKSQSCRDQETAAVQRKPAARESNNIPRSPSTSSKALVAAPLLRRTSSIEQRRRGSSSEPRDTPSKRARTEHHHHHQKHPTKRDGPAVLGGGGEVGNNSSTTTLDPTSKEIRLPHLDPNSKEIKLQQFEDWLRSTYPLELQQRSTSVDKSSQNPIPKKNLDRTISVVDHLIRGKGITHKGTSFKAGVKITLAHDLGGLEAEARTFEEKQDVLKTHQGWLVKHPVRYLKWYKQYLEKKTHHYQHSSSR